MECLPLPAWLDPIAGAEAGAGNLVALGSSIPLPQNHLRLEKGV